MLSQTATIRTTKMVPRLLTQLLARGRAEMCHPLQPCLPHSSSVMHRPTTARLAPPASPTIRTDRSSRTFQEARQQQAVQEMAPSNRKRRGVVPHRRQPSNPAVLPATVPERQELAWRQLKSATKRCLHSIASSRSRTCSSRLGLVFIQSILAGQVPRPSATRRGTL